MRLLALGRRCIAKGGSATFVGCIESEPLRRRVTESGVALVNVAAESSVSEDLEQIATVLEHRRGGAERWVVVDGYRFDSDYYAAIRGRGLPLLVIDDLAGEPYYHADIVLNQNLGAESLPYRGDADTRWLLGARYALLQPEFDRWRAREVHAPAVARRLMVTVGGADPHGATALILDAVNRVDMDDLNVTVVAGPAARDSAGFAAASRHSCRVTTDVRDMASLMASVDVAVSGGGSTCWELAYLGVPAIVIELSDNQRPSVRALAAAGAVENAGAVESQDPSALGARIAALCLDASRRQAMSDAGRGVVDGSGGSRVVGRLGLGLPPLTLHRATAADSHALWALANEPSVRQHSFDPSPIAWETHIAWFERISASPTARMWILSAAARLAAQVRYELTADGAEIGISVAPDFRGFGLAARLLASTWAQACRELGTACARGVVFTTNRSSAAAFREAGFVERGGLQTIRCRDCHVFTKSLES